MSTVQPLIEDANGKESDVKTSTLSLNPVAHSGVAENPLQSESPSPDPQAADQTGSKSWMLMPLKIWFWVPMVVIFALLAVALEITLHYSQKHHGALIQTSPVCANLTSQYPFQQDGSSRATPRKTLKPCSMLLYIFSFFLSPQPQVIGSI
jgi:hypothetical protein